MYTSLTHKLIDGGAKLIMVLNDSSELFFNVVDKNETR